MNSLAVWAAKLGQQLIGWAPRMNLVVAALLAVALLLDRWLARRVAASARVWLYALVAARLILPVGWQTPFGLLRRSTAMEGLISAGIPLLAAEPAAGRAAVIFAPAFAAGLLYLAVVLVLLARWGGARLALRKALRSARPAPPFAAALLPAARVLEHPALGPLVAGLLSPRVVLPSALLAAGDSEHLRWVMRHEGAHLGRRDQLLAAAVQIGCILAWPVLPLWIAAARVRALVELAADERALAGAAVAERRRYGEVLLALADAEPAPRLALVPSFGTALRARVTALGFSRRWPVAAQLALVAAIGAVVLACAGEPDSAPLEKPAPVSDAIRPSRGSIDKEVIRGVIVDHINEVKRCYENELVKQPELGGRVLVRFTIAASGRVVASEMQSSTMHSPPVETCIVQAVGGWEFPRPEGGGIVIVSYPFLLTPN